jgi:hypothetical protein
MKYALLRNEVRTAAVQDIRVAKLLLLYALRIREGSVASQ